MHCRLIQIVENISHWENQPGSHRQGLVLLKKKTPVHRWKQEALTLSATTVKQTASLTFGYSRTQNCMTGTAVNKLLLVSIF